MNDSTNVSENSSNLSENELYIQNARLPVIIDTFKIKLALDPNNNMLVTAKKKLNDDMSKYDMVQSLLSQIYQIEKQPGFGFFTNTKDKYKTLLTIINNDFKDNTGKNLDENDIKERLGLKRRGGKSRKTRKANKRKSKKSKKANKRKSRKN